MKKRTQFSVRMDEDLKRTIDRLVSHSVALQNRSHAIEFILRDYFCTETMIAMIDPKQIPILDQYQERLHIDNRRDLMKIAVQSLIDQSQKK